MITPTNGRQKPGPAASLGEEGKQYEIDLPLAYSIRGEEQEQAGSGFVCAFRVERARGDLAIRERTGDAHLSRWASDWAKPGHGNCLVENGPFDNE